MSSPCISDVDESNPNGILYYLLRLGQNKFNKSKPSELPTLSLQINGAKIADLKILTKFTMVRSNLSLNYKKMTFK